MAKITNANVGHIQVQDRSTNPTGDPASGNSWIFVKSGGLYIEISAGTVIGPFGTGSSIDASAVTYTPSDLTKWNSSADPGDADDALNQLASRVKTLEGGVFDASTLTYTPGVLGNWNSSADPGDIDNALDQLASRTKTLENNDGKVLVASGDTTFEYLQDKLAAGTNVTFSVTGTTDKLLTISATGGGGGGTDDSARELAWADW